MLQRRNSLGAGEIATLSKSVQKSLFESEQFRLAEMLGAYFPFGSEVQTNLIIDEAKRRGKLVGLPRVEGESITFYELSDSKHLVRGRFGIMEPLPFGKLDNLDLIVVPGVAFDRKGYRLGYGKGYYDKLLAKTTVFSVGLAYGFQLLERLPHSLHDIRMNSLATEDGITTFHD